MTTKDIISDIAQDLHCTVSELLDTLYYTNVQDEIIDQVKWNRKSDKEKE